MTHSEYLIKLSNLIAGNYPAENFIRLYKEKFGKVPTEEQIKEYQAQCNEDYEETEQSYEDSYYSSY